MMVVMWHSVATSGCGGIMVAVSVSIVDGELWKVQAFRLWRVGEYGNGFIVVWWWVKWLRSYR